MLRISAFHRGGRLWICILVPKLLLRRQVMDLQALPKIVLPGRGLPYSLRCGIDGTVRMGWTPTDCTTYAGRG